jgi:hypothetical protein
MARKKKLKPFRAVTAVKAAARAVVGTPPATRREPASSKAKKEGKHKRTLGEMLADQ